jgi:hypothetical protein
MNRVETWSYSDPSQVEYGSALWNVSIPTARGVFTNGVLSQWVEFGPDPAEAILAPSAPKVSPGAAAVAAPVPADPGVKSAAGVPMLKGHLPPALRRAKASLEGWPVIVLSGVLKKGNDSLALLNGEVYARGEKVEGVDILYVGAEGVLLKFKDEMHFVEPGDSTRKPARPSAEEPAP